MNEKILEKYIEVYKRQLEGEDLCISCFYCRFRNNPKCLKYPQCISWIADEGLKPSFWTMLYVMPLQTKLWIEEICLRVANRLIGFAIAEMLMEVRK